MSGFLDLESFGLKEWTSPGTAAAAAADSQKKLQAALIATRLDLQCKMWSETDRGEVRKMQRALDDLNSTGILLASLLRAEREG